MTPDRPSAPARRSARIAVALAAIAGPCAAAAAPAGAASITISTPCVVYDQATASSGVPVAGTGFTPGDDIEVQSSPGDAFGTATVNPDGTFGGTFSPSVPASSNPFVATFTMTATDQESGITASTTFMETDLGVDTVPARAKPTRKVTWNFSGFSSGAAIYGHYLHKGRIVATKRFGVAAGACGTLSVKSRFFPGRERFDSYKLQFDDSKAYSATAAPKIDTTLTKTLL